MSGQPTQSRKNPSILRRTILAASVLLCAWLVGAGSSRADQSDTTPTEPRATEDSAETGSALEPNGAEEQTGGIGRFSEESRLMYTTYFYTAGEAVVHGYEEDTHVSILSMNGGQPVWTGVVGPGEAPIVPTGAGVFAFISDKRASILVGTPSSCAVVGYWPRDENGSFRSHHFYTMLPSFTYHQDDRVIIWAWEDTDFSVVDVTADQVLHEGSLEAGGHFDILYDQLQSLNSHILYVQAQSPALSVQIYYDEGFSVPSRDGRTSGTLFQTYVGNVTEGANDLNIVSYHDTAQVLVQDVTSGQTLWQGAVEPGEIRTLTLSQVYTRITSDIEVSVSVAPYRHYTGTYAEHHFNLGAEGTGIENSFLVTTPEELWLFSYYDDTFIRVTDAGSGQEIWTGKMNAGSAQGLFPGHGYYRIASTRGISVLGGSQACGGEFSPASSMFAIDEAVLQAVVDVRQARLAQARERGVELSEDELNRSLTEEELDAVVRQVRAASGNSATPAADINSRIDAMQMQ